MQWSNSLLEGEQYKTWQPISIISNFPSDGFIFSFTSFLQPRDALRLQVGFQLTALIDQNCPFEIPLSLE